MQLSGAHSSGAKRKKKTLAGPSGLEALDASYVNARACPHLALH